MPNIGDKRQSKYHNSCGLGLIRCSANLGVVLEQINCADTPLNTGNNSPPSHPIVCAAFQTWFHVKIRSRGFS